MVAKKGVLCHRRTILLTLKTKLPYFLETDRSELMWNFIPLRNFDMISSTVLMYKGVTLA